jgi:hypothetical protein
MQMDYSGHIFVPPSVQLVAVATPIASDMARREVQPLTRPIMSVAGAMLA